MRQLRREHLDEVVGFFARIFLSVKHLDQLVVVILVLAVLHVEVVQRLDLDGAVAVFDSVVEDGWLVAPERSSVSVQ